MKRLTALAAMLSGLLMLVGAKGALADDCGGLGGTVTLGVCEVPSGTHNTSGLYALVETLHLNAGAVIVTDAVGIDIEISSGDFVMEATARIDAGAGGGNCPMGAPIAVNLKAGNINLKPGSAITSNACSGGPIVLTTTDSFTADIDGLVESVGSVSGTGATQPPGGGTITIIAGCSLTVSDAGIVSSRGGDPGADLVHLQGCTVTINGLVESTGSGHALPNKPANHCNLEPAAHPPGPAPGDPSKDAFFTGCVEIWSGTTVTIDSTGTHKGEVNADIGFSGGTGGRGWIDIYANGNITIKDGTGNDRTLPNGGCPDYVTTFAVHSNGGRCQTTDDAGLITIKSLEGDVAATSGDAIQADATSAGSNGGEVHVEAFNNVTFTANLSAQGDSNATGGFGDGGDLGTPTGGAAPIRAFHGALNWTSGTGNVQPTGTDIPAAQRGEINLEGCTLTTAGASFPSTGSATTPTTTSPSCAGGGVGPTKATVGALPVDNCLALFCSATKQGTKFKDANNNHYRDAFELGLVNWEIRAFSGTTQVASTLTDSAGNYTLNLPAGSYTVCEVPQAGWTQTCPQGGVFPAGTDCLLNPITNAADCKALTGGGVTPVVGYAITLKLGDHETGNDFGNNSSPPPPPPLPPKCVEDPARTNLMTRVVDPIKTGGGGAPGNPAFYQTVQAAYNAARDSAVVQAEVIGLFNNTTENLVLDGPKAITITQCTVAKVTASLATLPVWDITATGKLTIIGPDSVGGTVGWKVGGNGGHTLKSIRANGARYQGVLVTSNNNSLSFNDVSGNGSGGATDAGIRVTGNTNTLKSGTIGPNNGDGIQLVGNGNTVSGMNSIAGNTGNGVFVSGSTNTVSGNGRINQNTKNGIQVTGSTNTISSNASESGKGNTLNGIYVSGGSGNQLSDNKMQSNGQAGFNLANSTSTNVKNNANSNNTGNEFTIGTNNNVGQSGNKKNGTSFTFGAAGGNFN